MASQPTWIPQKVIIPLIQAGIEKEPELPDVPLIIDQAVKPADKPLLEFMARVATVGDRSPPRPACRPSAWRRCARRLRPCSRIPISSPLPPRSTWRCGR